MSFEEAVAQRIEDAYLRMRNSFGGNFAGRSDRYRQAFPFQIFCALNALIAFGDDNAHAGNVIAVREVNALGAFGRNPNVINGYVNRSGLEGRNQTVKGNVLHFNPEARRAADRSDNVHVKAHEFACFGILEAKGRVGRIHAGHQKRQIIIRRLTGSCGSERRDRQAGETGQCILDKTAFMHVISFFVSIDAL